MKRSLLVALILSLSLFAEAQQIFPIYSDSTKRNDIDYFVQLNEVSIVDKRTFENDLERYKYNQMKNYVGKVLPYVDQAVKMFHEIDQATANMSRGQRRRYVRSREKDIKAKFEDKVKKLNRTQGAYMVKAINRNLGKSCYSILKEMKNPITAAYYRTASAAYGIDLDENYKPENNKNFESIMLGFGY